MQPLLIGVNSGESCVEGDGSEGDRFLLSFICVALKLIALAGPVNADYVRMDRNRAVCAVQATGGGDLGEVR